MVYSPNAFKITYLGLDGVFTIDPKEIPATDPRNPPRVVFRPTLVEHHHEGFDRLDLGI